MSTATKVPQVRMGVLLVVLSALWLYLARPGVFGIIGYSSTLLMWWCLSRNRPSITKAWRHGK